MSLAPGSIAFRCENCNRDFAPAEGGKCERCKRLLCRWCFGGIWRALAWPFGLGQTTACRECRDADA